MNHTVTQRLKAFGFVFFFAFNLVPGSAQNMQSPQSTPAVADTAAKTNTTSKQADSKSAGQDTFKVAGKVVNLWSMPVGNAKVILSFAKEKFSIATMTDSSQIDSLAGTFKLSYPIPTKTAAVPETLTVKAPGYDRWSQKVKRQSSPLNLYVTLKPTPQFLFLLLLAPGLLGVLCWQAIRGWNELGKKAALTLVNAYFLALTGWVALEHNWLRFIKPEDKLYGLELAGAILVAFILVLFPATVRWVLRGGIKKTSDAPAGTANGNNKPPKPADDPNGNDELETPAKRELLRDQAVWFVGTSAILWVLTIAGLFYAYWRYAVNAVMIFQPELQLHLLVPVFTVLGLVVYAAANISEHFEYASTTLAFRKTLMTAGERILIGPYIAMVADFMLFHPFVQQVKLLSEGVGELQTEAFLAFFTGLYVKQVFDRLEQFGMWLLTKAAQEKQQKEEETKDELVEILGMHPALAQEFRENGIVSIMDLHNLSDDGAQNVAKAIRIISAAQMREWKRMACLHIKELAVLRVLLDLNDEKIAELRSGKIASLQQLNTLGATEISQLVDIGTVADIEEIKAVIAAALSFQGKLSMKLADELQKNSKATFGDLPEDSAERTKLGNNIETGQQPAFEDLTNAIDGLLNAANMNDEKKNALRNVLKKIKLRPLAQYFETTC